MTGLRHAYGRHIVLDGVDLEIPEGEVHALLGENGAGKSTLIKIVSGALRPSAGKVEVHGRGLAGVAGARGAGVVTVHQNLGLVDDLDAMENMYLGRPYPRRGLFTDRAAARRHTADALAALAPSTPLDVPVRLLSPVQRTAIALARALEQEPAVLILDEPTASLTAHETEVLFGVVRELRERGTAIIYVTHRMAEVFELCDRVVVLRDRRVVARVRPAETDPDALVALMTATEAGQAPPRPPRPAGEVVLGVDGLTGHRVGPISFEVARGQVVGVAGLGGSGRSELLRLIGGVQRSRAGQVRCGGRAVRPGSTRAALTAGIALVGEDRQRHSIVASGSVRENLSLGSLTALSGGAGLMRRRRELALYEEMTTLLQIRAAGPEQPIGELSGGNQQKVVLGRVLATRPQVLLLDEPTAGVDVAAKQAIRSLIGDLAARGAGVVVVSSDLGELLSLADRILVLVDGRLAADLDPREADEYTVLRRCYGGSA
ncbi:sugar ABC transporter ATP-binding protein [Herbidospora yilanensis]|uniref:sugar ABC transporter ATP-binding protein n=1 Tax=Herbidospora yilanensis TaxID=354426 RepID=UPI0018DB00C4|nr:sugar ABC transporter ATP-binding protein [Herbidospora yilanensis]